MEQDIFETTKSMVETIEDEASNIQGVKRMTSDQMLREEVGTFVVSEMKSIQSQNTFRDIIINELVEKVRLHELDAKELLSLYRGISSEKTANIQALLDMFKPTSNTPNPLLAPKQIEANLDKFEQSVRDASDEDLQGVWIIFTKILDAQKKIKEAKEKGVASEV